MESLARLGGVLGGGGSRRASHSNTNRRSTSSHVFDDTGGGGGGSAAERSESAWTVGADLTGSGGMPLQRVVLGRRGPGCILGDEMLRERGVVVTVVALSPEGVVVSGGHDALEGGAQWYEGSGGGYSLLPLPSAHRLS